MPPLHRLLGPTSFPQIALRGLSTVSELSRQPVRISEDQSKSSRRGSVMAPLRPAAHFDYLVRHNQPPTGPVWCHAISWGDSTIEHFELPLFPSIKKTIVANTAYRTGLMPCNFMRGHNNKALWALLFSGAKKTIKSSANLCFLSIQHHTKPLCKCFSSGIIDQCNNAFRRNEK